MTSYGTCLDDAPCKETELTEENGSVFITKFKPESDLCFVAKAQGESHLVWWQQCVSTPLLDRKTEITINLENTEVNVKQHLLMACLCGGFLFHPNQVFYFQLFVIIF